MKKIIALLLVLAMALGLVACGGSEAPAATEAPKADAPAAEAPATEKTEVTVIAAEYGGKTRDWWTGFEQKFEAANSDIDLVVEVVAWADINVVVDTRNANGQSPDLLNIDAHAKYLEEGLLLPTSEWVSEETFAKFYPGFVAASMDNEGTVWAIPDLASARFLYVNTDILAQAGVEKAPATWSEVRAACEAIKANVADVYPWGVDMSTDEGQACFSYYVWNNEGGFVDANGNWTLNSAANVEAIEFIIGMVKDGLTNSDPAQETRYANQDMFGAGKVAMMIGPNSIPTYLEAGNYSINWGVASIPTNNSNGSVSQGVMDRFMCFDNDYSDAELAAVTAFFDFFYEDTRYSDWVIMEGFLPATKAGGEIMAAKDPANAAWIEIVGSSYFYPTAKAEWADVKQGVINVLQQALLGGNVQELLNALQTKIAG